MKRHITALIGCLALLLTGMFFFWGLKQAEAASTMSGDLHSTQIHCADCHTLNNDESEPGTMGIRQDQAAQVVFPVSYSAGNPFPCEFCHRDVGGFPNAYDKKVSFGVTSMSYTESLSGNNTQDVSHAPSAHPINSYNYDLAADGFDNDGDGGVDEAGELYSPFLACTNCHDRDTAVYPTHEFSDPGTAMPAVQARLLVRSGPMLDPDPWDSIQVQLGSMNAWYSSHDTTTAPPVIDYEANPSEADSGNFPFMATDFCLTCHDADGFPADPYAAAESSTYRIPGRNAFSAATPGTVPDVDSLWTGMGHYIKNAAGVRLKIGDKIPCAVCHSSHSSGDNVSLLNSSVAGDSDASDHTPIEVCLRCHDANRDGNSNAITGIPMLEGIMELVPPAQHEGRPIPEHALAGFGLINSCLAPYEVANPLNDGCHQSPHAPRANCGGCHPDEELGAYGGVKQAARGRRSGDDEKRDRGVSQDYYTSHPINLSLDIDDADIKAIKEYYYSRPERALTPDPVPLWIGNSIYCTTCHNNHGDFVTTMDSTVQAGDAKMDDQAALRLDKVQYDLGGSIGVKTYSYPDICTQCHERVIIDDDGSGPLEPRLVKNPHGGFNGVVGGSIVEGSGAGMCNKCHSMHGRHPYSSNLSVNVLEVSLHYGMFEAYESNVENLIDAATGVYKDVTGVEYQKGFNSKLLHKPEQHLLCGKCHGVEPPPTGDLLPRPPNIYFPHESNNYREDTFFKDENWLEAKESYHSIDEGNDAPWGEWLNVQLRCGSCHNPHGSDNYAQLRQKVKLGVAANSEAVLLMTGVRVNAVKDETYNKILYYRSELDSTGQPSLLTDGIVQLCTSCHTDMGEFYYKPDEFDTTVYKRHPMNADLSKLQVPIYNFDKLVLQNKTTSPNDGEVFCLTCHMAHGSSKQKLRRFERTESCQLYCHMEIVNK